MCVCLVIRKIIKMIVACWKPLLFALKARAAFWAPSDTKMSVYLLITWGEIWRGHLYPSPPESLPAGHVQGCVHKRKWGDLCGGKRLHWDESSGDGKGRLRLVGCNSLRITDKLSPLTWVQSDIQAPSVREWSACCSCRTVRSFPCLVRTPSA